jgi:hypothetical protein
MNKIILITLISLLLVTGVYVLWTTKDKGGTNIQQGMVDRSQTTSTIDTTADPATTMSKHTNVDLGFSIEYPSQWKLEKQGEFAVKIFKELRKPVATETNLILVQVVPTKINISDSAIYDFNRDILNKLRESQSNKIVVSDNEALVDYFTYEKKPGITVDGVESKLFVNTKPWEKPEGTTEYKHIFDMDNKLVVLTAFLGNDTSDQFHISEENYLRIINTLKFSNKDIFSEVGTITGKLCYPSEGLPEGTIEAKNLESNTSFEVAYPGSSKGGKSNYEVVVLPGEYILRYKTVNADGYHTDVCPTGLETSCNAENPREHLTAKVINNSIVNNVDLCDFYYGTSTKPEF